MSLKGLVILLFVVSFAANVYGGEVCFSDKEAKDLLVEVRERREMKELIEEQEKMIDNLKKQVSLLQEQVRLLREMEELRKNQANLYRVAYEEEKRKATFSFFDQIKSLGFGMMLGALIILVGL